MQRYYRAAKSVTQLNTILLQNLGADIFPEPNKVPIVINERFQMDHELLDVRDERGVRTHARRHPRKLPAHAAAPRAEGHDGAHPARPVAGAPPRRARLPPRPGQPGRLPASSSSRSAAWCTSCGA
jgi:hypothetical protein